MRLKNLAEDHPARQLNHKVAGNLASALRLKTLEELTPKYLSNISASQLLDAELTLIAIADAQRWLVANGTSLKRRPPESKAELEAVERAIATLDAFQFDTAVVRAQLHLLQHGDA